MRKFKMGLITLAASAAVIVPAGSAVATSGSASYASTPLLQVDIYDIANGNTIETGDISVIKVTCGLNGTQVLTVLSGQITNCNTQPGHGVRPHK